ncbi:MAG: hypothetical protein KGI00_01370 [Candidatus Micrarchaeota archaeon]|nr:hypothetical protein [Candidatus Micrarchaeota archaeon]MDE1824074.1 hypothetical protein [Candidatus Micrarchaeota archaeon]MDE1849359.1 hypothetical protein [Candidatus Micrarchaeota archaeon]
MAPAATELSTIAVFVLSLLLAIMLTLKWRNSRKASMLFWSVGMWLFAFGVMLEVLFAYGVYSQLLGNIYLFSVALLVEILALGSMQLIKSRMLKNLFYAYTALITVFVAYSLIATSIGNIVIDGVVYGALPQLVIISSSLATFPAAIVIVGVALKSYLSTKNARMLSIVAGVVVVSAAGTLYIASFPAFLYFAELAGIALLWLGFMPIGKGRS